MSYKLIKNKKYISIETFTNIPNQIDGYACFLFNSSDDLKENKNYIGAGDDSYNFFLSINGNLLEFLKKDEKLVTDKYLLNIAQTSSEIEGNEYYEIKGVLSVTDIQTKDSVSKDFVGYCAW